MDNDDLVRCRRKNKHLSKQIARKFKQAQRIHRKKSKNYKGKSIPKNSFKRPCKQAQCIEYDDLYFYENCSDNYDNDEIEINNYNTDETPFAQAEMKIIFRCHLESSAYFDINYYDIYGDNGYVSYDNYMNYLHCVKQNKEAIMSHKQNTKKMCLTQEIEDVSLRIHNNINNIKNNNIKNNSIKSINIQYKQQTYNGEIFDSCYSDACQEEAADYSDHKKSWGWHWKDNFTSMETSNDDNYNCKECVSQPTTWITVRAIERLMSHHLSLYMKRSKDRWNLRNKRSRMDYFSLIRILEKQIENHLFDHKCRICSYDINNINQEIDDWMDEMYNQLNFGDKKFSCGLYSSIIMQYMFDNSVFSEKNCETKNKDMGMCFIELNISSKMTYQLWYEIDTMEINFDVDDCNFSDKPPLNNYNMSTRWYGFLKPQLVKKSFDKRIIYDEDENKKKSEIIEQEIDMIVECYDFYRTNESMFEMKWIISYIENYLIENKAQMLKYVEEQGIINHCANGYGKYCIWLSPIRKYFHQHQFVSYVVQ